MEAEMAKLLLQYPVTAAIIAAWPLLFVGLLVWVMRTSAERERRLIEVNSQWQVALRELTEKIDELTRRFELWTSRGDGGPPWQTILEELSEKVNRVAQRVDALMTRRGGDKHDA
ncbi:MAG: hypothetical protein IMX00_04135 [Limnochordales bacterium]|nr:hypothetical protein [Limnochordales bacterium]